MTKKIPVGDDWFDKDRYRFADDEPENWILYYLAKASMIVLPLALLALVIYWK